MIRHVAASLSNNHCPHRINLICVDHDVNTLGRASRFILVAIFGLAMSQYSARSHVWHPGFDSCTTLPTFTKQ